MWTSLVKVWVCFKSYPRKPCWERSSSQTPTGAGEGSLPAYQPADPLPAREVWNAHKSVHGVRATLNVCQAGSQPTNSDWLIMPGHSAGPLTWACITCGEPPQTFPRLKPVLLWTGPWDSGHDCKTHLSNNYETFYHSQVLKGTQQTQNQGTPGAIE